MRSRKPSTEAAMMAVGLATLLAAPAATAEDLDPRESYSYLREVEGTVTISSVGASPASEGADVNQPLLTGDQLRLPRGSRAEAVLADRTLLRLGGGASLTLARIAFSGDRDDRVTTLDLEAGEIVLQVGEDALGDQLPEVRAAGATLYVQQPGRYRVTADQGGWTEVVVREGYAELVSDRGSTIVRAGEAATLLADRYGRVEIRSAPAEDALERWGRDLYERAQVARTTVVHVDPNLAYAAAPLASHGDWVYVDASWAWRPRVATGWRPYWNGRWSPTPSGLTWVSYEPWGWVPYHYGSWFVDASFGWCWRPGRVYSPAWVYWHWSDNWVGWVPIGYYTNYYRHAGFGRGFHFGVYGWAGGGWGAYSDWHFAPTWCLRQRDWRRHQRSGRELERLEPGGPARGIVTTDTRGLTRERLGKPAEIAQTLAARRGNGGEPLVDVTDFVARKRELPPRVAEAVGAHGEPARSETPLGLDPRQVQKGEPEPGWRSSAKPGRVDTDPAAAPSGGRRAAAALADTPRLGREPAAATRVKAPEPVAGSRAVAAPEPKSPAARPRLDPANPTPPRQGWKSGIAREPATPPASTGRGATRQEPVQRVIGGVRRSEPAPPPSAGGPSSRSAAPAPRGVAEPAAPNAPRYMPPAGTPRSAPPSSSPRYVPPTASPRAAPPTGSARSTPPSSSPRYAPPPASARPAPPTARTAPAPKSAPPPQASSPPPARSSSPRTSSPPARSSAPKASAAPRSSPSSGSRSARGSSGSSGSSGKQTSPPKGDGDGHR